MLKLPLVTEPPVEFAVTERVEPPRRVRRKPVPESATARSKFCPWLYEPVAGLPAGWRCFPCRSPATRCEAASFDRREGRPGVMRKFTN